MKMMGKNFGEKQDFLLLLSAQHRPHQYPVSGRIHCYNTFLVYLHSEPIGSALPKFPSENKVQTMTRREKDNSALLCTAQGYPIPVFRLVNKALNLFKIFHTEPIGSAPPKLSSDDRTTTHISRQTLKSLSITCPAQASPIPAFR